MFEFYGILRSQHKKHLKWNIKKTLVKQSLEGSLKDLWWSVGGQPTTYLPPFYGAACSQLPARCINMWFLHNLGSRKHSSIANLCTISHLNALMLFRSWKWLSAINCPEVNMNWIKKPRNIQQVETVIAWTERLYIYMYHWPDVKQQRFYEHLNSKNNHVQCMIVQNMYWRFFYNIRHWLTHFAVLLAIWWFL